MVSRTVLATIAGSAPYQRLLVALIQRREGRVAIDLCEQHYADGIGWFDLRTLAIDPGQFKQLAALLNLKATQFEEAEAADPAIIPFPGPMTPEVHRLAVGDES